jgi:prolyl oligopeptidase PreP (S9A serine peptidase family)
LPPRRRVTRSRQRLRATLRPELAARSNFALRRCALDGVERKFFLSGFDDGFRKFADRQDRTTLLDILNARDRIPWIVLRRGHVYNFWQDEQNPKGLWRRTTLASYRTTAPKWEVLLDIDVLAKAEVEDWVWRGNISLPPAHRHGLVQLSRGGSDAVVVREFDLTDKRFVEGGFFLPEAKGGAAWLDENTLLVSTALGGDPFQTTSGYARTVRCWQRGMPFAEAPVVFECEHTEMAVWGWREHGASHPRTCFIRRPAPRLACKGGSNGGLLVGNMLTRYPDLFGAIDCAVPLLDMKRYTKFTAGASWISEYGDPEKPEDWAFLKELSAYHHVEPSRRYPPILLTTSARDDRVHPAHARKMAAKLALQGHCVHFYEPNEGGHAGVRPIMHTSLLTSR